MLPDEIKYKVKELWDKFWSGGISNPLNAIEQITYLLFLKQLDEKDQQREKTAEFLNEKYKSIFDGKFTIPSENEKRKAVPKTSLRWSSFTKLPSDEMFDTVQTKVFPFIKQLNGQNSHFTKHMQSASFLIPSPRLLAEAVKKIDEIFIELEKEKRFIDAQGDFYEELLRELNTSGKNGQFRTPTHIIELIIELVQPKLGSKIADPACGTAGFLIGAYKYIITSQTSAQYCQPDENGFLRGSIADKLVSKQARKELEEDTFFGFDIDPTMIRIGLMNLMMHGISVPKIDYNDTLSKNYNEDECYDMVLANPPFTGNIDKGDLNPTFSINTTKSELLFLERIYKMLRPGGTAAVIVPQGVLFGSGSAFRKIRQLLLDNCKLSAIISLPSGVFKPYAGVATAILVFTKGGESENVWFYDMISDGRTLDDKRSELFKGNGDRDYGDLHEIITQYRSKDKSTNRRLRHFIVPTSEIVANEYDFSFKRYREEFFEELETEDPQKILLQLSELEKEIQDGLNELKSIFQ
ncbi:SAM-dependent DNA methyltransferase [Chitinophaga lutea]|uniref:site-specific DNA-methyltransferase (adenine-specific) n=1 Tax=Chitinophaga lutea TaxID=2488634 RepID=A0A3N4Q7B6_9BACT|nr:class I SAM-dependent DNA methyltransferase [Chitinophaga lutea]RPE13451.1 SAM-dependent DNA methyltransferase [Chitinophaga lutea]